MTNTDKTAIRNMLKNYIENGSSFEDIAKAFSDEMNAMEAEAKVKKQKEKEKAAAEAEAKARKAANPLLNGAVYWHDIGSRIAVERMPTLDDAADVLLLALYRKGIIDDIDNDFRDTAHKLINTLTKANVTMTTTFDKCGKAARDIFNKIFGDMDSWMGFDAKKVKNGKMTNNFKTTLTDDEIDEAIADWMNDLKDNFKF